MRCTPPPQIALRSISSGPLSSPLCAPFFLPPKGSLSMPPLFLRGPVLPMACIVWTAAVLPPSPFLPFGSHVEQRAPYRRQFAHQCIPLLLLPKDKAPPSFNSVLSKPRVTNCCVPCQSNHVFNSRCLTFPIRPRPSLATKVLSHSLLRLPFRTICRPVHRGPNDL